MTRRSRLRKAGRVAGYAAAGVVALAAIIAVGAPIYFRGERFGRLVEAFMPVTRGHVHVGGGHWSWSTVIALVRGRAGPLAFDDVTITDPEGAEVLHLAHLTFAIEVHRGRPTRMLIHDLVIKDARWRFATLHGSKKIGFLTALETVPHGPRKAPSKPGGTEVSIDGARLEGVLATFDMPTWGLVLRDVHARAGLALKAKTFTWEVDDADVRDGGELRILSPAKGIVWPFERGRLDRVATTADAPDSIRLTASGVVNGVSRTGGSGLFTGIYGLTPASRSPAIDLEARIADGADMVNAIIARRGLGGRVKVGGAGAEVRVHLTQPFDRIAVDADARGFDVTGAGIEARKLAFHAAAEPNAGRVHLERLSLASPGGGRAELQASLDRLQLDASVTFTRFAARAVLPSVLRPFAGDTIDGTLHARGDLREGNAELVRSTLVIARADGAKGPSTVALLAGGSTRPPPGATVVRLAGVKLERGVLRLPRVSLAMWGGGFAAEGRIALWDPDERRWLSSPRLDLGLQTTGIDIGRLVGSNMIGGAVSFRAHAVGAADDLDLEVTFPDAATLTVLGERVRLPARAQMRLRESTIVLADFPLGGPGNSLLVCAGKVGLSSGRLALDVGVREFPIGRLPGLLGTTLPVAGSISGAVRVVGEPRAPALSGEVTLADVSYRGRPLGGGTITIVPEKKGAVRARGRLIDAIAVDGRLAPKPSGLEGEVALKLTKVPLEPFLPALPGKPTARGRVSGTAVARIAPDHPATAEGRLTELALSLTPPPARGKPPAGTIEVTAENEIVMRARAGEGLSFGPARLRSNFGTLELSGESHGDDLRASLRGRLELGGVAAFARPWLERLAGAADVDITATGRGTFDDIAVSGGVTIAAPLSLKLASFPVEAWVPSGRVRIAANAAEVAGLPIIVRAERFPIAAVRKIDARARVSARVDGAGAAGKFGARVLLDSVAVEVPLAGRKPIRSTGGEIDVAGDARSGKLDLTRIDLPIAAEVEGLTAAPGATVDRATVAVRVHGNQRQLAVSGDVDVGSAHVSASALRKKASGGAGGTGAKGGPLAAHPEIEAARLDVRLRSRGGAIHVDVNNLPDLRVDLDMHVGGTVKKPSLTGTQHGANFWSSFVLALARLFS
ncbi:MAG TPA: hypothetical protein VIF57_17350 [Polyangia bacterium]